MIKIKNLSHWSLHVTLCSAPSFYLAHENHNVIAMCIGIVIFILFYTILTSSDFYHKKTKNAILSKAIRWATNLRTSISVIGGLGLILGKVFYPIKEAVWVLFLPDLCSGLLALRVMEFLGRSWPLKYLRLSILGENPTVRSQDPWLGDMNSFFPTLGTVLVEGVIISVSLFTMCLILFHILNRPNKMQNRVPVTD